MTNDPSRRGVRLVLAGVLAGAVVAGSGTATALGPTLARFADSSQVPVRVTVAGTPEEVPALPRSAAEQSESQRGQQDSRPVTVEDAAGGAPVRESVPTPGGPATESRGTAASPEAMAKRDPAPAGRSAGEGVPSGESTAGRRVTSAGMSAENGAATREGAGDGEGASDE